MSSFQEPYRSYGLWLFMKNVRDQVFKAKANLGDLRALLIEGRIQARCSDGDIPPDAWRRGRADWDADTLTVDRVVIAGGGGSLILHPVTTIRDAMVYQLVQIEPEAFRVWLAGVTTPATGQTAQSAEREQPADDDGRTTAEYRDWFDAHGYRPNGVRRTKKELQPLFLKAFPDAGVRGWNRAFGKWAGTTGQRHRPRN